MRDEHTTSNRFVYRGPSGKGPRITAIGGGTGLSTMLRGLKRHTNNLTAIVTVADTAAAPASCARSWGCCPRGMCATAWRPWPTWSP